MAIKITCDQTPQDIERMMAQVSDELAEQIFIQLGDLGLECVNRVRDRPESASWYDHSGCLRSSIGASVIINGKECDRIPPKQTLQGAEGVKKGNEALDKLISKYATPFALVVSAGMDYASHVEKIETKDVLASTRLWAEKEVGGMLKKAVENAHKRLSHTIIQ